MSGPDALAQLLTYGAQLPQRSPLHPGCAGELVRETGLGDRTDTIGVTASWKEFKKRGGLCVVNANDWAKMGRYSFAVSEGFIQTLRRRQLMKSVSIANLMLGDKWKQTANCSDWDAQIEKPPPQPLKLHTLFAQFEGPNSHPRSSGKDAWAKRDQTVSAIMAQVKAQRKTTRVIAKREKDIEATLAKAREATLAKVSQSARLRHWRL